MKADVVAEARVATEFAATGRWQKWGKETGCQINQKVKMSHPPFNFPGIGGRIPKGLEKLLWVERADAEEVCNHQVDD